MTPDFWLPDLTDEKKNGWAFYLHYEGTLPTVWSASATKPAIGHLFVTEAAAARYSAKMLDFARKKAAGARPPRRWGHKYEHRAIALYGMGWRLTGSAARHISAGEGTFAAVYCEN